MPANAFIGLESIRTSNMLLKHVLHASATIHRNLDNHSSQPQPLNAHGNTLELTSCTLMAMSTSSSLTTTQRCPLSTKYLHPQCNAAKTISILKELFAKHGIPELLCSDNGPQFASTLFAEFATDWNFDHCTSAPTNPQSNGQAEAAMKIVKGLLS